MEEGIIEKIVTDEIDRNGDIVFTEFKTDIMLSKNKTIGVYLGNLKIFEDRYAKPEGVPLSDGKRDIKIKIKSIHKPVTELWLKKGFEFFKGLNQKYVKINWHNIPENIKKLPKTNSIFEFIDSFNREQNKKSDEIYCSEYGSIPLIEIGDEIKKIKKFVSYCSRGVDFEKASLNNYFENRDLTLEIRKNLFDFYIIGTNPDVKKYSKMVDEFLR